jgi:hypothetical protein
MEEIIMRTVLVNKEDIEVMVSQIEKHLDVVCFLIFSKTDDMYDVDAYYIEKTGKCLSDCLEKLKSYLK